MQNPISYLKQTYPINNNWLFQLRNAFVIGLFISVFLTVFQPFGLSMVKSESKMAIVFGYGVVSFLVLLINTILLKQLFPSFFREEKWTIWKQMLFLLWIIFSIGLANSIYTTLFFSFQIPEWKLILKFQFITLAVGIIPILAITIISQNHYLRKNLQEAKQLNFEDSRHESAKNRTFQIIADNGKDHFTDLLDNLLFIQAEGNYIFIYYLQNEVLKKAMLRNTLSDTEKQLSELESIMKTHRAYLANLEKVKQISGNSQGLRLQFTETEMEVPVSRSFVPAFKQAWHKH